MYFCLNYPEYKIFIQSQAIIIACKLVHRMPIERSFHRIVFYHLWLLWLCHTFRNYLLNSEIFGNVLYHIKRNAILLYNLPPPQTFLHPGIIQREHRPKHSVFYCWPSLTELDFLRQILLQPHTSNFIKIRPVGADSLHADRRTDLTMIMAAFCICAEYLSSSLTN